MSYLEKRGQHSTGWWYGEYKHKTAGRFRARFKTKDEADAYEAHVRAFGQEPDWAHTADLEELKLNVEKLSDDLRVAEERIRKLEEELSLTRRDITALTQPKATELPEDTELKEWHQAFRDTFKALDQAAQPKGDERRGTERLYRIEPLLPPQRLGEIDDYKRPRRPDEWAAAEEFLRGLNFQTEESDNVVAYKLCHEHFVVLADPRADGEINFCVFDSDEIAQLAERRRRRVTTVKFRLLDWGTDDLPDWRDDLVAKFRQCLSEACSSLARQRAKGASPQTPIIPLRLSLPIRCLKRVARSLPLLQLGVLGRRQCGDIASRKR
jgi:hypothetical protein